MATLVTPLGPIGIDPQRYTVPVGTASTTIALSGFGEHKPGTTTFIEGNKSAVYAYVPSTYGTITAGTRFDLSATFETVVNASGKYTTPASTAIPAGTYFWATIFASAV